jgi:hypothetical protein
MHLSPKQRPAAFKAIVKWILLCLIAQVTTASAYNFTNTLSALTNHNTSAYSAYNSNNFSGNFNPPISHVDTNWDTIPTVNQDMSLNPITPGHVSKTDVHTLIPSRPDLRWFAHVVPWFGSGGHISIGVNNNTTNWVQSAINDMINRGFNGAVIDWYGSNHFTDQVTQKMQSYLASRPGNTFKLIIMVDGNVQGGVGTNNLLFQIKYVQSKYFSDTNYERETNNLPILMFFNVRNQIGQQNMANLKAMAGGNMVWVEQGTGYIHESWEDQTFQWTDNFDQGTPPPSNNPFNTNTVISTYGTISTDGKFAFGGMCARFNGTLTRQYGWSDGKYLPCSNGLCLVQRAALINANIPHNMTRMQWPTWNDWEEGSEIETGIENNVALNASVNGSGILSWSVTAGESRAIDHYEIYASTDGINAALIASVPTNVLQTNLTQTGLPAGTYYIYVDAIGLPCVRDHMSGRSTFTMTSQTLIPTDYSRSMKITFSGYNRGTMVSGFPVLVELSTSISGFAYNQFMSPTANDLRFTDSSGNVLNHEIDQWNTNGVSYVWVEVPSISSSTDYIMAYWGNRADTSTPSWTTNGSTWANASTVMHLKESTFPYLDSTTLHTAATGSQPSLTTTSEIGSGETFNGTSQYLVPAGGNNLGSAFSLSAWVKLDSTANNIQCVWANKTGGSTANGVALFINTYNTSDGKLLLESGDGSSGALATSTSGAIPVGGWHHVFASVNRSGGTATLYVDGANVTSTSAVLTDFANNNVFNMARYTDGSWYFKGTMDEARIESGTRTADWVWATWMNAASNSVFQNYGPVTLTKVLDQDAFTSGIKLTTAGYTHGTTLTNFPLLINFSTSISAFSYSQFASPNGYDLRFTDASGQILLNYQIDTWNTNGVSSVWVEVPSISSSTNYIMAYWGNPALTNAASFTTNGATWTNFSGVFHLKESALPYADSTTLHTASTGLAPVVTSSGEIGNAEVFNGTTEYLVPSGAINLGSAFSLSAWVKLDNTANNIQCVWANKTGGSTANGVALFINTYNSTDGKLLLESGDGSNGALATSTSGAVPVGGWHHVFASVNRSAGTATLYVDGANVTSTSAVLTDFANNNVFNMARYTDSSWYFKGTMDEARIESGTRTPDWVWATWMNVASNSAFVSYPGVIAPIVVQQQIQSPQLQMNATPSGLLFNWTSQGAQFHLYSTTNLTTPVQWSQVTNYTVLPDGNVQVPAPANSGNPVFYRLQSQ